MSNYRQRQKTMCDMCHWKMVCKDDGIVEAVKGTEEWIGVHFWLRHGKICPIDERAEQRRSV